MITTIEQVSQLGTILSLWAHPDDETFFAGGLMATAVSHGQAVVCLTATWGEQGIQDESRWPATDLPSIRQREWREALTILGVTKFDCLGFADSGCAVVDQTEAVNKIIQYLGSQKIDTVVSFGADGVTGHHDHKAVATWAAVVAKQLGATLYQAVVPRSIYDSHLIVADQALNIFLQTKTPPLYNAADCDIYLNLPPAIQQQKCQALACHQSQTERFFQVYDDKFWCQAGSIEAYKCSATND